MPSRKGINVLDAMCGGGGSSTGMCRYFERAGIQIARFVAINHDKDAIEVHSENYPWIVHYCQNIESVDLHAAFPDGQVDFAWASPSCTQLSRARGGRPINDQLRNGPWQLLTISSELYVKHWVVENVAELMDWSPLGANNRPLPSRRGEIFRAWVSAFENLGYSFEYRILNAADFGGGTTRERFFGQFTKKKRIYWPAPTFSEKGDPSLFGGTQPWRGAREFMDPTIPSAPIIDRKIPLMPPTLSRAAAGMITLWGTSAARVNLPDVRDSAYQGIVYAQGMITRATKELADLGGRKPLDAKKRRRFRERTTALTKRIARYEKAIERYDALVDEVKTFLASSVSSPGAFEPFLIRLRGTSAGHIPTSARPLDQPVPGPSAGGNHAGIVATEIRPFVGANRIHNIARDETQPMAGITTADGGGLFRVTPVALGFTLGQQSNSVARTTKAPIASPAIAGAIAHVSSEAATLTLGQHGGGIARTERSPFNTATQDCAGSIVHAGVEEIVLPGFGGAAAHSPASPLGSPTTTNRGHGVLETLVTPYFGNKSTHVRASRTAAQPLSSPTTENRHAVLESVVVHVNHTDDTHLRARIAPVTSPLRETTTKTGSGVLDPVLVANFGEREGQTPRVHPTGSPFPSVTHRGAGDVLQATIETVDLDQLDHAILERLLVGEDGRLYIARPHFRMLDPIKETSLAMGFPKDYKWSKADASPKRCVVSKLVGNAVQTHVAERIAEAAFEGPLADSARVAA